MRYYETAFIVNPQAEDAAIERQVRAVADLITGNGGKIIHEDRIGTRRLATPIGNLTQGYYTSLVFEGPTTVLPLLERHYRLEEPYVRYITILFEGDPAKVGERRDLYAELPQEEAEGGRRRFGDSYGSRYGREGRRDSRGGDDSPAGHHRSE